MRRYDIRIGGRSHPNIRGNYATDRAHFTGGHRADSLRRQHGVNVRSDDLLTRGPGCDRCTARIDSILSNLTYLAVGSASIVQPAN